MSQQQEGQSDSLRASIGSVERIRALVDSCVYRCLSAKTIAFLAEEIFAVPEAAIETSNGPRADVSMRPFVEGHEFCFLADMIGSRYERRFRKKIIMPLTILGWQTAMTAATLSMPKDTI